MVSQPQEVSTDSEEILRDTVNRREPLELSGRLETPHLALPLTRRLVGDLGSIVRVLISDVDHGRHHGAARGGVGGCLRHSLLIRQPICVRAATRTMTARLS